MIEPASGHGVDPESIRLKAVDACQILDTARQSSFDSIVFTAAQLFRVPMAMFAIVAEDRVWLKSRVGPLPLEWRRAQTFCTAVVERNQMLIVEDTLTDASYAHIPLVTQEPNIRFYAGMPILGPTRQPIGSLSVLDRHPRSVPERARQQLLQLARETEELLRRRVPAT